MQQYAIMTKDRKGGEEITVIENLRVLKVKGALNDKLRVATGRLCDKTLSICTDNLS